MLVNKMPSKYLQQLNEETKKRQYWENETQRLLKEKQQLNDQINGKNLPYEVHVQSQYTSFAKKEQAISAVKMLLDAGFWYVELKKKV